eukprot:CAMPEP_0170072374 /NCGR_PEP_ID=MMETSP0019_2-20121128/10031_1 /TAXON_ID=98059 /ORGANISM="Dinobryon sp., Strain UTEXLB2267" /LENGTH=118 /DNA_ID=CAMNT_0010281319 /DNA_START=194 /DNA_END=550 /DNA_ORIENTATION=-
MGKNLSKGVAAGFMAFLLAGSTIPVVAAETPMSNNNGDCITVMETIPRWDIYSRVSRLEETMFTKEDAKIMQAEMRADMKEMRDEFKASLVELLVIVLTGLVWSILGAVAVFIYIFTR